MKTVINIKADKEIKEAAQKVALELGLPLSTVINAYLKQFIRSREIYFTSAPVMTPALEALVGRAEKDLKRGSVSPAFSSGEAMDRYLDTP